MGFVKNNTSIRSYNLACANFHNNNEHPWLSATDMVSAANDS